MLIRSHEDNSVFAQNQSTQPTDFQLMGAGLLMICAFFIVGGLLEKVVHIPGPVLMILAAVFCKYTKVIPAAMELGAHSCYKFVSAALVWPLMIGLGMLYVPLESVVSVFSVGYVVVCGSIVIAMALSGFFIASRLNMYPVEAAIVTSCHSGLAERGCGHSLGIKPHGIDAVCPDCDAYRRGVDGDRRDAIELDGVACRRAKKPASRIAGR
jgi:malate:Na+ symporter